MRFENNSSVERENKVIDAFCSKYNLSYIKLGNHQLDFIVFNEDKSIRMIVEIKGVRNRKVDDNHTPLVSIEKLSKLQSMVNSQKYEKAVIIFAYEDGFKFQEVRNLSGFMEWGGRRPRPGSTNDQELIIKFTTTKFEVCMF